MVKNLKYRKLLEEYYFKCKSLKYFFFLSAIIVSSSILVYSSIHDGHNWGDDFALYIEQSKSITDSSIKDLYQKNRFSIENSTAEIGPFLYPFGFPLFLSFIYYFIGFNLIVMKIFCGLFFIASLPLIFFILNDYLSSKIYALLLLTFIAFHNEFVTFSDNILSDFPFLFFSMLSIFLIKKKDSIRNLILLGLSITFSYFIRDIGIVLIPTLFMYQLNNFILKKKSLKNTFKNLIPYLVFFSIFLLSNLLLPKGNENHLQMVLNDFSLSLLKSNFFYYLELLSNYFFCDVIFLILILSLILTGVITNIKQHSHLLIFTLFFFGVLLIWPHHQGMRFIFPAIPFLIYFVFNGILFFLKKVEIKPIFLVVIVLFFSLRSSYYSVGKIYEFHSTNTNQSFSPEMIDLYKFIQINVPQNGIISFFKPRLLRLATGRNTIFTDLDSFEKSDAQYLIIEKNKINSNLIYKKIYESNTYVILSRSL
jgi:hypothetical protein